MICIWARPSERPSPPATNTCFEYEMTAPSLAREYLPDGGRRVQYILYILGLALSGWKRRGILLISLPSAPRKHNSRTFWPTSARREGSSGDDGQSVCTCMFVYTRVNNPAVKCGRSAACSWPWSIRYHCQELTLIIAMANPISWTNEHCRQTGGGQSSQWHCLVWEGKRLFSPQISHTSTIQLQVGKPDPAFTHRVRSIKNVQHKLNDNCYHCSINLPAAARKTALNSLGREDRARKLAVPKQTAPTTSPAEAGFFHATTLVDLTLWSDMPQFDNKPAVPSRKLLSVGGKS